MMDSAPMVCITGNVPQGVMGTDAFQEIDILGVTLPIVKHSILVRDAAEIPAAIEQASHIAASGRPGPVLVDLPKDVQFAEAVAPFGFNIPNETTQADPDAIAEAERFIRAAKRPLIYIGGGVKIGRATEALRAFATTTGIPAVATLNALGTVPTDAPGVLGRLGPPGTRPPTAAGAASDLGPATGARPASAAARVPSIPSMPRKPGASVG